MVLSKLFLLVLLGAAAFLVLGSIYLATFSRIKSFVFYLVFSTSLLAFALLLFLYFDLE